MSFTDWFAPINQIKIRIVALLKMTTLTTSIMSKYKISQINHAHKIIPLILLFSSFTNVQKEDRWHEIENRNNPVLWQRDKIFEHNVLYIQPYKPYAVITSICPYTRTVYIKFDVLLLQLLLFSFKTITPIQECMIEIAKVLPS